ncbi:MAG: alpha-amylase [Bacteroidetes bacterium]|nr:MAG: alpha-amylase [Bacteroidota bacterium]
MYNYALDKQIEEHAAIAGIAHNEKSRRFFSRFAANGAHIKDLFNTLYASQPAASEQFAALLQCICTAYAQRPPVLKTKDHQKEKQGHWYLSQNIAGMSLYVDRFCGGILPLCQKLDYFEKLGVNLLHLMPLFESPPGESDGGYAVSNFRKVDERLGTLSHLQVLQQQMQKKDMYLMVDIVLNHTSNHHEWAQKARNGDAEYQDFFYLYPNRQLPDAFETTMPEVFPEAAPGNFTHIPELDQWVMTVFHDYQWDLNYTNPRVLVAMLDNIFFYANLGVDVLRIDAPAFIWKALGTTCQNLPEAHTLLRLIRLCVEVACPGMALLGEAIVDAPNIMRYFGTDNYTAAECHLAYNATHMALQWDMLATGDTRVMLAAQSILLQKPLGCTWINYTRCHDDIGLGYNDDMIAGAGYDPWEHRRFIKNYYTGNYPDSPARGALFGVNEQNSDARISGTLASLCGLETALQASNVAATETAIQKILLMQAHSFFLGGIPMLFSGDELGYTNDYTYLSDPAKSYDNRWMHRPAMDWDKNKRINIKATAEQKIFEGTQRLLAIRRQLPAVADLKNLIWLPPHNISVAGYLRAAEGQQLYCLFNFSQKPAWLSWYIFKAHGNVPTRLFDHWRQLTLQIGDDRENFEIEPYGFMILEAQAS